VVKTPFTINQSTMKIAIIPAGGQGRRMAGSRPKQFLPLGGIPLIVHTLRRFEDCPDIDSVIVVLPQAEIEVGEFQNLVAKYGLHKVLPPVAGATERQGSVYCGLKAIASSLALHSLTDIVAIHDAVRPFVRPEMISATVRSALTHGGAICALSATDTIKEVEDGSIVRTLSRERIYLAQTPQTFKYSIILEAHRKAEKEGFIATDDAMLVENIGQKVVIVEGSPENIKITKPADLILAELILNKQK
jgi:2-C-methyl-D-erythritol 4-phosphate cytidylyltransferase